MNDSKRRSMLIVLVALTSSVAFPCIQGVAQGQEVLGKVNLNNVYHVVGVQEQAEEEKNEPSAKTYYGVLAKNLMQKSSPQNAWVAEFEINDKDEDEIDQSLISDFWIGVQCEKAGVTTFSPKEVPGAQLKVEGGMKILAVTEGGAAEKAGVKEGDVLLKFAEKDMDTVNDLYAVIGEMGETENEAIFVREGELLSINIMPRRRPETKEQQVSGLWTTEQAIQYELDGSKLPKGYRLTIELERGKDVVVTAVKGKESWSGDSESIDKLPDELRPLSLDLVAKCKPVVTENQLLWTMNVSPSLAQGRLLPRLPMVVNNQDRLVEIYERLVELTKAVEQLKEKIGD